MKSKQEPAVISQQLPIPMEAHDLSNEYLLKGNTLYPLSSQHRYTTLPIQKKFRSGKEMEQLLLQNNKILFGEKTIVVSLQKKSENFFKNALLPNNFMLDLEGTPKFYFLDTLLPEQNFLKDVFPRITEFFLFLLVEDNINELARLIYKEAKKDMAIMLNGENHLEVITQAISPNASVLAFSERNFMELTGVKQLYPQPWRHVHSIVFKRCTSNGDTFCSMIPSYSELQQLKEKPKVKREKVLVTEEYHFEGVSEEVKVAYLKIKEELLKVDSQLQFNPQRYYIALKNGGNIAFFHIRKSKIDLVLKYSEKETKKTLKHFEVRPLKESVQKFWGGESVSVIIQNPNHLQELIGLLKKVLGRR